MGSTITLTSADGHHLSAYRAEPTGPAKGGVIVVQEIFGVNPHIRSVADLYAKHGYLAIAPAIYDRVEKGVELGYTEAGMQHGFQLRQATTDEHLVADIAAAQKVAAEAGEVGIVGYCFGGYVCWLASAKVPGIAAASGYYGGGIAQHLDFEPKAPTILHFGEKDHFIPLTDVEAVKKSHPEVTVYVYPADHGFNCDERPSYDDESASLARQRTLDFFAEHL